MDYHPHSLGAIGTIDADAFIAERTWANPHQYNVIGFRADGYQSLLGQRHDKHMNVLFWLSLKILPMDANLKLARHPHHEQTIITKPGGHAGTGLD